MGKRRCRTRGYLTGIFAMMVLVITVLGAQVALAGSSGILVDAGFESGADAAALASPPWSIVGAAQHAEYDTAQVKSGTKSAWLTGPAAAGSAGIAESDSAGMTSNGAELRFWMYNDTTNEVRYLYDLGTTAQAFTLRVGGDGAIATYTNAPKSVTGYTPAAYTTVGTYQTGWTQVRIVFDFAGDTFTLSTRRTISDPWTQLKATGAASYAIPMRTTDDVVQSQTLRVAANQNTDIWLDDVRYSNSGITDGPTPTLSWKSIQPQGNITSPLPVTIEGIGAADPLVASSAKLLVDGVEPLRTSYSRGVTQSRVFIHYSPTPGLADGLHTFRAEISDVGGVLYSHEWNARLVIPPTASWLSPAAGAAVLSGRPAIAMSLADNTPLTTFDVAGQVRSDGAAGPVVATFGGSGLSAGVSPFTLSADLAVGTYFLTATVTDAAGCAQVIQGTAARSFTVASPPAMTVLESCDGCHPAYRTAHPTRSTTDCGKCHPDNTDEHMQGTQFCEDCHRSGWHTDDAKTNMSVSGSCLSCHNPDRPEVPQHTAASVAPAHTGSCGGCHTNTSLITKHGITPEGSSFANQCDLCHASAEPRVRQAITDGVATCDACHDSHGADPATHTAPTATCQGADCHATTLLVDMHTPYVGTGNRYPQYADACSLCHSNDNPTRIPENATADCATCHPERVLPHGYDAVKHTTSQSCIQSCHEPLAGMTELKPIHDAVTTPVACSGCHATKVSQIKPWDKTCTACHPISDLHPAAASSHAGTDVAYQAVSFFGNGCTAYNTSGADGLACHDIGNIAEVHSTMPGNGCDVCHGNGATPAQECGSCHTPGDSNTYTVPGTPSADIFETTNPSSDDDITPGWTYTTTPASQPIYSVVNTPWTSGTPTRYVTITSNAAGGVRFGYSGSSIPSNARITHVEIYTRAKATSTTPYRKMQGVFKIGGQTYLSSNLSGNLTTAWTATTGGFRFQTSPTRIDYTRDAMYGELVNQNPATGQDWTPDELNGVDPDSSLQAFGVNLTASATANNISLAQTYLKVTYHTVGESVTNKTVGTHTYHQDNVKYLHDPSDMPAGQRFVNSTPAHGWYDALYFQDCYDICHRGNAGAPTFSANQGNWMWYSVGGDPYDDVAATRTLALKAITLPADAPTLAFTTDYQLGTGASGAVEISTDGGTNWTPLTGTVGGAGTSILTGNASGWVPASYDLSAYAGQSVKLRFKYVNGSSGSAGWAFDSLTIAGGSGTVYSDDAETLKPDWTNSFWTRSMGAFPYQ